MEIALPHPTHLPARLLSEVIDCSHVVDTRIRDLMTRVHVEITERIKTTKERLSRGRSRTSVGSLIGDNTAAPMSCYVVGAMGSGNGDKFRLSTALHF